MKERVLQLIGLQGRGSWIGTFHAMMLRILRRHGELVGYRSSFSIFDTADQRRVMADALKALGISERSVTPREALVSNQPLQRTTGLARTKLRRGALRACGTMRNGLKYTGIISRCFAKRTPSIFDDILLETLYLFQKSVKCLQNIGASKAVDGLIIIADNT